MAHRHAVLRGRWLQASRRIHIRAAISLKLVALVLLIDGWSILILYSKCLFIILALASLMVYLPSLSSVVRQPEPRITSTVLPTGGQRHRHIVSLRAPRFFVDRVASLDDLHIKVVDIMTVVNAYHVNRQLYIYFESKKEQHS